MKAILMFRLGGLGDLLVALPSIQLVRRRYPGRSLSLVCRREYGRLLEETGVVDVIIPAEDCHWLPLFDDRPEVPEDLRTWLEEFHVILGWFQGKTPCRFERKVFSPTAAGGRFIVYEPRSGIPVSRYFFDRTSALIGRPHARDAFEACHRLPSLRKGDRDNSPHRKFEPPTGRGRFAVVHPGSGSPKKCWPLENFLGLIGLLQRKGIGGFLVTGEAEERMERAIRDSRLPSGWSWLRRPPLIELAGLLEEADVYIGNDSGVTHLAAACGTPGLALFRNDLEDAWRPYGRIQVASAADVTTITVDSVIEKIESNLL